MRLLDDGGQYCPDCRPAVSAPKALEATVPESLPGCPTCGRPLESGTKFCAFCDHQTRPEVTYGGLFVRIAAYLIDGLVLGLFGLLVTVATNNPQSAFFLNIGASAVYFVGFWVAEGATPGKMVFNLKVRSPDGSPIDVGQGVLRLVGYWVNWIIFGIGFLVMLFNEEKRGLHDHMANTIVVVERD